MKVLVTNDDGINSPGIMALTREISRIAEVTVVAPDRERSATAHAITMHKPLRAEKFTVAECNAEGWRVNGTPSDCVKLAMDVLLDSSPDMVLSGINHGYNLGTDVIYSGTVSAAIEGALMGIPAVALSVAAGEERCFDYTAKFAVRLCQQIEKQNFPKDTLFNINVPCLREEDMVGVYITHLGIRKYKNSFEQREDPRGKLYYWMAGEPIEDLNDTGSDVWAVNNGYVSMTPVQFDLTKYSIIENVRNWNIRL